MKKKCLSIAAAMMLLLPIHAQDKVWTLDDCIDYAVSHNVNVRQRAVEVSQRDITLNTSKNAWLPDLSISLQYHFGFENPSAAGGGISSGGTGTQPSISTSMPVFDGFKIKNQIQADKFSLTAAVADLEAAKKDISIQVASLYLQCLYYKGLADVARKQVATSREMVQKAATLVETGKRPRSEQADAEAQLASDEHTLVNDEGQYTLALMTLAHALNIPNTQNFSIADDEQAADSLSHAALPVPQDIYDETVNRWPAIMSAQSVIRQNECQERRLLSTGQPVWQHRYCCLHHVQERQKRPGQFLTSARHQSWRSHRAQSQLSRIQPLPDTQQGTSGLQRHRH